MSGAFHRYTWHFADGVLRVQAEGHATVCIFTGEIAALLAATAADLGPAANPFLAGLFSGGLAASLGAVEVTGVVIAAEAGGR